MSVDRIGVFLREKKKRKKNERGENEEGRKEGRKEGNESRKKQRNKERWDPVTDIIELSIPAINIISATFIIIFFL